MDETPPGTGFGVSIASDIADLYEGKVELETSVLGSLKALISIP